MTPENDPVSETISVYEKTAREWLSQRPRFTLKSLEPLANFFEKGLKGKKILDAGCGP